MKKYIRKYINNIVNSIIFVSLCLAASTFADRAFISEFMAKNDAAFTNQTGNFYDWIEIHNPAASNINLNGWFLTDKTNELQKWQFPSTNIPPDSFIIVFASGNNIKVPGKELHTNFKLSSSGEFLALIKPDGTTLSHSYSPAFPPQVADVSYGIYGTVSNEMYFTSPTPGYANLPGDSDLGPVIKFPGHSPLSPEVAESILVTAQITRTFHNISTVELNYKVMFGGEISLPMYSAADNIFTSAIPAGVAAAGEMLRYYISAEDVSNNVSRYPVFATTNSDEYLGTVIHDPAISNDINVYHWFVEDTNAADTRTGTRCSLYFAGRFYDNIFCRLRGSTSAHPDIKKVPHKIEFNSGNYFKFADDEKKVDEINIIVMYNDGSYMRDYLSWQVFKNAGSPYCCNYYINLRQNAEFHSLAMFIEQIDGDYLRRNNLPDDCSLYKICKQNIAWLYNTNGFEKVRPKDNNFTDFQELVAGLTSGTPTDKSNFLYDNFDIPELVNFLAIGKILQAYDLRHNNFRMYHDFNYKNEWKILPWDLDLTFGHVWEGSNTFGNNDYWRDETWYGRGVSSPYWDWSNALFKIVYESSGLSNMFTRRLRTLMDEFLQPTNTPVSELKFEKEIFKTKNIIKSLADDDRSKWGWPQKFYNWPTQWIDEAVIDITNNYLAERRVHLYITHGIANGGTIPFAQPKNFKILFTNINVYPVSGNQKEEFIEIINTNSFAADISGWKLSNAVIFTFDSGTVIPPENSIYISPDVIAFRARSESPKSGEGNFIVGNYNDFAQKKQMLYLTDDTGELVDSIYVIPEPFWLNICCLFIFCLIRNS